MSWSLAIFCVLLSVFLVGCGILMNWVVRRFGVTGQQTLVDSTTLVAFLVFSVTVFGPWLPSERITLSDGSVRVGYVVASGDPMTVFWRSGGVVYLKGKNVEDRQICSRTILFTPGIFSLGRDSTSPCPDDKVTTEKP
jgi:hypothetical protein